MRLIWAAGGVTSLGLGTAGAVLPLLPTVPFILLAAYCFSRSSPRLHDWLLAHNVFGPMIQDWRDTGAISPRAKKVATLSIIAAFGLSVALGVRPMILLIQAVVLTGVMIFIWSRPAGPKTEPGTEHQADRETDSG